ncbi:hypothetical protein [Streptomyces sp. NBC_01236]|uniref:hypothetical protein n=1 Tax=Streptomyces sp. NBC_01236 TaxID=2903789 RepID=UPI002E145355|nr:hypothetical protein OG324_19040 [Streptomyces sp. NBC_01236]
MSRSLSPSRHWARVLDLGPEWVGLPVDFSATGWADPAAYAQDIAAALITRDRELGATDLPGDLGTRVADQILDTYTRLIGIVPAHFHLLLWPDLSRPPIPVFLGLWEPEQDRASAEAYYTGAGEYDEVSREMPVRERFVTDALGDGVRVLSLAPLASDDPEDADAVLAVAAYHWRTTALPTDVQLLALTHELGRLYSALPALDAFARGIVLTDTPTSE